MAGVEYEFERTYSFHPLHSKKFLFLQDKDTLRLLMKWSMLGRISAQSYSFDQTFYPYNSEKLAMCFFTDPDVVSSLPMNAGARVPLDKPVLSVDVESVPCTRVSMELFDPVYSCGIVLPTGHVAKYIHDTYGYDDKLRQMVQDEDSEHYDVFGPEERGEFLFRLFKHLYFGGTLCQYEDSVDPYLCIAKQIYKDLISVQKDPETETISVVSTVLKVCAHDESGPCYPGRREEEQTFAYLVVDPIKRHVTLFQHFYGVGDLLCQKMTGNSH
ncbi:cilia- and flagella-associated protein 300 [Brachionichthys hirsutus]|uniref:cilia- and flagella-associated protein 300 n=1 Tax=Brachionichthys hirsutus TaxID=412623 RepID=UPI0036046F66